jgi:hypothetical protein
MAGQFRVLGLEQYAQYFDQRGRIGRTLGLLGQAFLQKTVRFSGVGKVSHGFLPLSRGLISIDMSLIYAFFGGLSTTLIGYILGRC